MRPTEPLTVRTTRDQVEQIDAIAAYHEVLVDKIKAGVEQADAGDLIPHSEVVKRLQVKPKKRRP